MIRRPPRSTLDRSSAASDVYKRQFDRYLEGKNKIVWIVLSFIFVALSFLAKPYTVFFLPVFVALLYSKYGLKFIKKIELVFFGIACIIPLLLWRKWIGNFPEGIPVSSLSLIHI